MTQGFGVIQLVGRGDRRDSVPRPEVSANRFWRWRRFDLCKKQAIARLESIRRSRRGRFPSASLRGRGHAARSCSSHRGADGAKFSGYAADAPHPSLVQILNGEKQPTPMRSAWKRHPEAVEIFGGGYTVMQLLLIDVSHQLFSKLLRDTRAGSHCMTPSTYEQPLPQ